MISSYPYHLDFVVRAYGIVYQVGQDELGELSEGELWLSSISQVLWEVYGNNDIPNYLFPESMQWICGHSLEEKE